MWPTTAGGCRPLHHGITCAPNDAVDPVAERGSTAILEEGFRALLAEGSIVSELFSKDIPVNIATNQVSAFAHCLRAEVQQGPGWAITGARDEQTLTAHLYFHRREPVPFTLHVPWRFKEDLTAVTILIGQSEVQSTIGAAVNINSLGPGQLDDTVEVATQIIRAACERRRQAILRTYDIVSGLLTDGGARISGRYRYGPFVLIPEDPDTVLRIEPEGRLAFTVRAIDEEHAREVAHEQAVIGAAFLAVVTRTRVVIRRGPGRGVYFPPVPHESGTLERLWASFRDGISVTVRGPSPEPPYLTGWLRVPSDIGELYERYAKLPAAQYRAFTNAMLAYQTALDLQGTYDTLSAVGLVAALNALAPRIERVRECPDCGRQERVPADRQGVLQLIRSNVPAEMVDEQEISRLADRIYGNARSGYVHKGELRGKELIGSYWAAWMFPGTEGLIPEKERFREDLGDFARITNTVLVNWLLRDGT